MEIGQVLMVIPDDEQLSGTVQPVTPFLKCHHQGQELTVPHTIVALCLGKVPAEAQG